MYNIHTNPKRKMGRRGKKSGLDKVRSKRNWFRKFDDWTQQNKGSLLELNTQQQQQCAEIKRSKAEESERKKLFICIICLFCCMKCNHYLTTPPTETSTNGLSLWTYLFAHELTAFLLFARFFFRAGKKKCWSAVWPLYNFDMNIYFDVQRMYLTVLVHAA